MTAQERCVAGLLGESGAVASALVTIISTSDCWRGTHEPWSSVWIRGRWSLGRRQRLRGSRSCGAASLRSERQRRSGAGRQ